MNHIRENTESFNSLFRAVNLGAEDKKAKTEQILSYLEVIDAQAKKFSHKRRLVAVDCAAGNCWLSFLVYHYYADIMKRDIEIHCIDRNGRLMEKARALSEKLGFVNMVFHSGDILDAGLNKPVDILYTLHACDDATDKALYFGLTHKAGLIFSVTCCQHSMTRQFRGKILKGMTRYKSIRTRLVYFVADTMRAHLVALQGYEVDVFDFTSARNTDKNIMIRAKRNSQIKKGQLEEEYRYLRRNFAMKPYLEKLLEG